MTTITIRIPDSTEARLRKLAQAAGKSVEQLAGEVLEAQTSGQRILAAISGDVKDRFVASRMSEDDLADRLEREDHVARGVPYDE